MHVEPWRTTDTAVKYFLDNKQKRRTGMYLKKKENVLVLYVLADLISFLEIKRLQLAGSSCTVFAINLILLLSCSP